MLLERPRAVGGRANHTSLSEDTDPEQGVAKDHEPEHPAGRGLLRVRLADDAREDDRRQGRARLQ